MCYAGNGTLVLYERNSKVVRNNHSLKTDLATSLALYVVMLCSCRPVIAIKENFAFCPIKKYPSIPSAMSAFCPLMKSYQPSEMALKAPPPAPGPSSNMVAHPEDWSVHHIKRDQRDVHNWVSDHLNKDQQHLCLFLFTVEVKWDEAKWSGGICGAECVLLILETSFLGVVFFCSLFFLGGGGGQGYSC